MDLSIPGRENISIKKNISSLKIFQSEEPGQVRWSEAPEVHSASSCSSGGWRGRTGRQSGAQVIIFPLQKYFIALNISISVGGLARQTSRHRPGPGVEPIAAQAAAAAQVRTYRDNGVKHSSSSYNRVSHQRGPLSSLVAVLVVYIHT